MEVSSENSMFSKLIQDFGNLTKSVEIFLQQSTIEAEGFKDVTKTLYGHTVQTNALTTLKTKSLTQLLTNGFDEEQIWQQIELQNKNAVSHLENKLNQIDRNNLALSIDTEVKDSINDDLNQLNDRQMSSDDEDDSINASRALFGEQNSSESASDDENSASDSDSEDYQEFEGNDSVSHEQISIRESHEKSEATSKHASHPSDKVLKAKNFKNSKHASVVDDQFFKLANLEQFLRLEDLKEEKARDGDIEVDSDEEDIDLFQDIPSDDMDDETDGESEQEVDVGKSSKDLMYEDFYDVPESGDESVQSQVASDNKNDEMDLEDEQYDTDENDDTEVISRYLASAKDKKEISKTPHELKQENINKQIEEYEKSMLKPKEWQLTGEVDASNRPTDALLNLQTDFEINAKPIVIQDKELCEKLETMIKMTIKNKAYSDGVRQYKSDKEVIAYKKELAIDQNKSKKSLAQEYEDMYLKKQKGQEEEENPKHIQIKKLMDSLFPELHALFSHIPKPAVPEIKIVSNLPALSVEEVAPTSVSDVTMLAPEEVKKRTGIIKGQTERTDTDRKRERRKKKLHQKLKHKKKDAENSDGKPISTKDRKQNKLDMLKKLKQHRNTKIANMDGEKIKSSKDFFEKLQDTVNSKGTKAQTNKKKQKL